MPWICQLLACHPLHLLILIITRHCFFPPGFGHFHIIMNYDRDTRRSDFKPVSLWHFISNLQPFYQLSPHFWVSGWWRIYWLSMSSLEALFQPLLKRGSTCAFFFFFKLEKEKQFWEPLQQRAPAESSLEEWQSQKKIILGFSSHRKLLNFSKLQKVKMSQRDSRLVRAQIMTSASQNARQTDNII